MAKAKVDRPNSDEAILANLEKQLEEAERRSYMDRGRLLKEIKGEGKYTTRFYRTAGFDTFEEYCEARWGYSQQQAFHLVHAYEIVEEILKPRFKDLPSSERATRPLTTLRNNDGTYNEEAIVEVWGNVKGTGRNGAILAKDVAEAVEGYWAGDEDGGDGDFDDQNNGGKDDEDLDDYDEDEDDKGSDDEEDGDEESGVGEKKRKSKRSKAEEEEKKKKHENRERRFRFHDKFVKLLSMLGSDSDNETLTAARKIEELRKSANAGWEDVLVEIYGTGLLAHVRLRKVTSRRVMERESRTDG